MNKKRNIISAYDYSYSYYSWTSNPELTLPLLRGDGRMLQYVDEIIHVCWHSILF